MAMSNAEKQRRYRQRHLVDGMAVRLTIVVNVEAKRKLDRLSKYYGVAKWAALGRALAAAEHEALAECGDSVGYYAGTARQQ